VSGGGNNRTENVVDLQFAGQAMYLKKMAGVSVARE